MGSYHDIDFTTCEGGEERLLLPPRPETREGRDPNRIVGESLPEGMEVLLGEVRRRSEDCDLGAILYCLEGRSDRDLGLPITVTPTDQPVHRPICLHIPLHIEGGLPLVGRILIEEARLHLFLPPRIG